ncbi:CotD family spore coat protein [Caldalkalibacillus mannanilyticus]|uniref:CotD family spore coat protein n=1 Tax=Caldalkalibacillus mannanilyticus TaxID=1418 RepID=UPI0009DD39D0
MYCRPVVHPTRTIVKDVCCPRVVPHIHPSQTIVRHNYVYNHKHYFPHVRRDVATVRNIHTFCPPSRVY